MVIKRYLTYQLLLIVLALPGCTVGPEADTTLTMTATASVTVTLAIAGQMTPQATATPTPMYTPTATPLSATDVWATLNAPPIIDFTPSPTATPRPTFTPIPGPVWPLIFLGVPCPADQNFTCSNALFMHQSSRWYLINSDGSGLVALEDVGITPTDLRSYPRFSPDGARLAYVTRLEPEESHIILANADGSDPIDLGLSSVDFRDLGFLPETDCLAVLKVLLSEGETVTIEKVCVGQSEPQILDTVDFPGHYFYRLSPQGDALLAYGEESSGETGLYAHEIGSNAPPLLLFSESEGYFRGFARWLPDGQRIEFISGIAPFNEAASTSFYTIDRNRRDLELRINVTAEFTVTIGDWSPEGREYAFIPGLPDLTPETSGIYILDLESGEWRQILSEFYVTLIQAWGAEVP